MKKIISLLIFTCFLFASFVTIKAEVTEKVETKNVYNFNYHFTPDETDKTISSITMSFNTDIEFTSFVIKTYDPKTSTFVTSIDSSIDYTENEDIIFDVKPVDKNNLKKGYLYTIKYNIIDAPLGTLHLIFDYTIEEQVFKKDVYVQTTNVHVDENAACYLNKFNYYVVPDLGDSTSITIHMSWYTKAEMEDLIVRTYSTVLNEFKESFSMEWDLEDSLDEHEGVFFKVKEPKEDDKEPIWQYELAYKLKSTSLGSLNIIFSYRALEQNYQNVFYVQAGIYKDLDTKISTTSAIAAATLSTVMAGIGTFLIINASMSKNIEDEENELNNE